MPEIEELLPHRGALRWLDAAEGDPAGAVRCRARIRADNPFLVEGRLPALCLCELLAQAGAALAGLEAEERGETAGPGYLIAIRELDLRGARDLVVGAEPEASVRVLASRPSELGDYCELEGEVALGSLPIARGSLALLRLPGARLPDAPAAAVAGPAPGDGPLPGLVLDGFRIEAAALRARLTVSSSCPLFADHFPGHPVLPAAAELVVVARAARGAGWLAGDPEQVGRTKFRRPIRPGSVLELGLRRDGDVLRWSLSGAGAAVGSGEFLGIRDARGRSAPDGGR